MIKIDGLYKSFGGHQVLKGVSLEVQKGEIFALIGQSGGGKSVLLKHVAGLMKADQGRVTIDGKDVGNLGGRELAALRQQIGFLFQGGALFDSLTVFENVAFPLREKTKVSDAVVQERVLREIGHVGLSGSEHKYPSQLSGGMVKRAALARALVTEPGIMLFDEPTTGLDPIIGLAILRLINSSHRRLSFTGIIVTHETERLFKIVNRVAMLKDGVIYASGTPRELMSSDDPAVQAFVRSIPEDLGDPGGKHG